MFVAMDAFYRHGDSLASTLLTSLLHKIFQQWV